ncbi:MAG: dihydroneopterin aldolase [Actinomycetota bacterium]|nr:dihydroneopterin aldolase [Actinomycetota bacterium]
MTSRAAPADPDRLELRGLRLTGTHGVLPEERERPQPFEVDLDVVLVHRCAVEHDELTGTADYGAVVDAVAAVVGGPSHQLLESLAAAVADAVLADPAVAAVTVTLRKLRPPVPHQLTSAGVRLTRSRG